MCVLFEISTVILDCAMHAKTVYIYIIECMIWIWFLLLDSWKLHMLIIIIVLLSKWCFCCFQVTNLIGQLLGTGKPPMWSKYIISDVLFCGLICLAMTTILVVAYDYNISSCSLRKLNFSIFCKVFSFSHDYYQINLFY